MLTRMLISTLITGAALALDESSDPYWHKKSQAGTPKQGGTPASSARVWPRTRKRPTRPTSNRGRGKRGRADARPAAPAGQAQPVTGAT